MLYGACEIYSFDILNEQIEFCKMSKTKKEFFRKVGLVRKNLVSYWGRAEVA